MLIFLICLGVAILFRSFNLTREFSGDEVILTGISTLEFQHILPALKQRDVYPPLTYLMLHQWMRICHSEVWVRLYFVIYGIAACIVIYYIAKELLDIHIARISLLLASFSPLLIFASQYVRSYMDSGFWMLLSSLFMLRIIKGRITLTNWVGYIFSSILSIYTFYFSFTLILSQFIFVTFFMWREKRFLFKWYLSFLIIAIAFLPWTPSALNQLSVGSGFAYDWSNLGFNLGGLRLGLYTRNLYSLIGFDPHFMFLRGGISAHFASSVLAGIIGISLSAFIVFLYLCHKYLRERFSVNRTLEWFLLFFAFGPIVISWICGILLKVPLPSARYLVAPHGIFLLLMGVFIFSLWEKKPLLCYCFLGLLLGAFVIRIPHSVISEVDIKRPLSFLKENFEQQDCLVCVRSCPPEGEFTNTIQLGKYMALSKEGSKYIVVSHDSWKELSQRIISFQKVWFYRFGGNVEIFGANQIVDDWLKNMGYKQRTVNKFRHLDIVEYEK